MAIYPVIGLMSGTSLDGLDVCFAQYEEHTDGQWRFHIEAAHCYTYDEAFRQTLRQLPDASALELSKKHTQLGKLFGNYVLDFFQRFPESRNAGLIVSHGQTIFHQPDFHFTTQIGCGATIAALTKKAVVCDLRTMDVALGGQGAPLVPMGERHLFPQHQQFLNIGGICNIAQHSAHTVKAFDVCPGNTLLNYFAAKAGKSFDENGDLAALGKPHSELLQDLNDLPFYRQKPPRSLGTEHILQTWIPLIESYQLTPEDALATCAVHIAQQIGSIALQQDLLVTGGGAYHRVLVAQLQLACPGIKVVVPEPFIINFKEALIMGFLGLLRSLGRHNALASVTGAAHDSVGGALYLAPI